MSVGWLVISPKSDTGWPLVYVAADRLARIEFRDIEHLDDDPERLLSYTARVTARNPDESWTVRFTIGWDDPVFYPRYLHDGELAETDSPPAGHVGVGLNPRPHPTAYEAPILFDRPGGPPPQQPSIFARVADETDFTASYADAVHHILEGVKTIREIEFLTTDHNKRALVFADWNRALISDRFFPRGLLIRVEAAGGSPAPGP